MRNDQIITVIVIRLIVSLTAIYLLDLFYYQGSLLNWGYAILIGVCVMLLDPRGATIIVRIMPIGSEGFTRMNRFIKEQNSNGSRWQCSTTDNGNGVCKTFLVGFCAETFSLFGRVLAWEIYENIPSPKNAKFTVSVENGAPKQ